MAGTRTYDPAGIIFTFGGILISGYAPDTFITATRNSDAFTLQVGAGGQTCRSRSQDKSGTITVSLMQSSPTNDVLSALADIDEKTGSGLGAVLIKDVNGTTVISAENAWIKKKPEAPFAKEASIREWVIETGELDHFIGGILV